MIQNIRQTLLSQYEASLNMLKQSLGACPSQHWDAMVGHSTIRQDAYHTLFWCSYYLTQHEDLYEPSEYHTRGGNELEPVISPGLEKEDTLRFIEDTHDRIVRRIADETEATMSGDCGFPSIFRNPPLSRLELHVYNIRHLQHHVGQINITLRRISDAEGLDLKLPWVGPGWP